MTSMAETIGKRTIGSKPRERRKKERSKETRVERLRLRSNERYTAVRELNRGPNETSNTTSASRSHAMNDHNHGYRTVDPLKQGATTSSISFSGKARDSYFKLVKSFPLR